MQQLDKNKSENKHGMAVLLLNMPFAQLCWPNLGLSLLKGGLIDKGFDCDLKNLCFPFAERVGYDLYDWIAGHFAFVLGGEHLFAKEYFDPKYGDDRIPSTEQFWNEVLLHAEPELDANDKTDYFAVADAVRPFLDDCMDRLAADFDSGKYGIVGFTTSFQQTFPSLCLARRIKKRYPETQIVFGGAACEGEMGRELLRQFQEIDFVFLGEADLTFPEVVRRILDGTVNEEPLPDGVLSRFFENGDLAVDPGSTGSAPIKDLRLNILPKSGQLEAIDLDKLPPPNFDEYFEELHRSPLRDSIRPYLFCETSRGCWWGERRQCAFCGLNGHSLRFRCKTPQRVVDEIAGLIDRYGVREVCFADNIFAKEYFETFLPLLKNSGLALRFEFEMKANQKKEQTRQLVEAGLEAAQLGIETFSTPILKMLSKGATARHNLQVLKWYTAAGIIAKWNILYGFPGEDPLEYEKMIDWLPLIYHFHPPTAFGRVRIDRFAPYHNDPEKYGVKNLRPYRGFRFLYPFEGESLRKLSYYHEFDFADGRNIDDYIQPFLSCLDRWEAEHQRGTLKAFDREDGVLLLTDTRPIAVEFQYRLSGLDRELYLFCDTARTREEIARHLAERFSDADSKQVDQTLQRWIDCRIMLCVDHRFFALSL